MTLVVGLLSFGRQIDGGEWRERARELYAVVLTKHSELLPCRNYDQFRVQVATRGLCDNLNDGIRKIIRAIELNNSLRRLSKAANWIVLLGSIIDRI